MNWLESEASSDASHKSYCDDELAKVSAKEEDLQTQVATRSSMLEAAVAKSSVLDGEVAGCRRVAGGSWCPFSTSTEDGRDACR